MNDFAVPLPKLTTQTATTRGGRDAHEIMRFYLLYTSKTFFR